MPNGRSDGGGPLLQRLIAGWRASLRAKLLTLTLLPLLAMLPLLIGALAIGGGAAVDRLLIGKVRSDLVIADEYLERVRGTVGAGIASAAASKRLADALAGAVPEAAGAKPMASVGRAQARAAASTLPDAEAQAAAEQALVEFLRATKWEQRLDFVNLLGPDGSVRASSDALTAAARQDDWPVLRDAIELRPSTAIDVFPPELLAAIDPALAERARTPIVATRNAAPSSLAEETRGMVIHSAAPVTDANGRLLGILQGGQLLNGNLAFVDRINGIVYPNGSLPEDSHGTATLFLGDVRIATNVRLFGETRAIGTRVSQAVRDIVLGQGETWLDRAFVVKDWYVSGYRPLIDSYGRRVGMLYVGFLEAPFIAIKSRTLFGIVLAFLFVTLVATWLLLKQARAIFHPVERMERTMAAVAGGDEAARVGAVAAADEIGTLARHLDELLDTVGAQKETLRRWGDALDAKVAERTRDLAERTCDLEQANRSLKAAQRQLVMSEKLAAIGELTAGVAHEINNPVAVIQGNLDLMRELLGNAGAPVRAEMRLIDDQVERIRLIVAKLLQFARPTEFAGYVEPVDVRSLIADTLLLVGHIIRRERIEVTQEIATSRLVTINHNELQQILINLIVNAVQAMAGGGTLTIRALEWDETDFPRGVVIEVADTGCGIAAEDLDRIFNPFFTTKRGVGTGLGLSISYGLIERYGGRITADSVLGRGALFRVFVPQDPVVLERQDAGFLLTRIDAGAD